MKVYIPLSPRHRCIAVLSKSVQTMEMAGEEAVQDKSWANVGVSVVTLHALTGLPTLLGLSERCWLVLSGI